MAPEQEEGMNIREWKEKLEGPTLDGKLHELYGALADENKKRYEEVLDLFGEQYGDSDKIRLFSAPGRTEIGGNHTDHQNGRVLAASVNLDTIAAAAPIEEPVIRVFSKGHTPAEIDIRDLSVREDQKNSSHALLRGVVDGFAKLGCKLGGMEIAVTSSVLSGSGISSSAAYEVLLGNIINNLYFDESVDAVKIAQIGQYAENVHFGKPSGLLDQMASSVGNILTIDFKDTEKPVVKKLDIDFDKFGLALCIVNSGADHVDLTDEYAAIPREDKAVCDVFGKNVLREITIEDLARELPRVREQAGDRAALRALHFLQDNDRVTKQVEALEAGDIDTFLTLVNESGLSSWLYLQNIVPCGAIKHQEMAVALAVSKCLLGKRGASRVHGGGFAGTIQAFVPKDMLDDFKKGVDAALGEGSCQELSIRPVGGTEIR